jgi:tRNA-dependent cyclodipeptide synthase
VELLKTYGGSAEDLLSKQYNISVGCSLSNKWFTPENVRELTAWAIQHTKERVCIYVADSIHAINIEARGHKTRAAAQRQAKEMGRQFLQDARAAVAQLPDVGRVDFSDWSQLETPNYRSDVQFLYDRFDQDDRFRETLVGIVEGFVAKESRQFRDDTKRLMATYILEELPVCLNPSTFFGHEYGAWIYPQDSELSKLMFAIQDGTVFPEIAQRIVRQKKMLGIVR